ncbi:sirohydrochlorin chelatase [Streptacidiphilus sp. P02-A3a]|uniref:sirohydrochlorin chelatase n=1 Tax=Streptacidiphilus sp. P02-A3a TaxID=2704468 RepID=UPI0015FD4AEC|nr:CbiX/SirB N-terminal domain-containing protein [Streptacidiphilus sp. P02-A3a]QMU67331.1 sirohydrochlorin chelatase [Streptacidiphilus sp. P02-A3a]
MPSPITVVLAVHGTRNPAGTAVAQDLAFALADQLGLPVHPAYADVHGPTVADVLRSTPADRTPVLVPAFLSSGHHVHTDIPAQILGSGRTDTVVTPPPGPASTLLTALTDRLAEAGAGPGDSVVLGAAGSRDPAARAEVAALAQTLGRRLGTAVSVGWAASARPTVAEAVADARSRGARRVSVATWLLAPGLFADRINDCGADAAARPLGTHPALVQALAQRVEAATRTCLTGA